MWGGGRAFEYAEYIRYLLDRSVIINMGYLKEGFDTWL